MGLGVASWGSRGRRYPLDGLALADDGQFRLPFGLGEHEQSALNVEPLTGKRRRDQNLRGV